MIRNIFANNAQKYLTLGWSIFPLAEGEKVPMKDSDGFKSASANPAQIAEWCKQFPHANIGIACGEASNLLVIDMDPRNGSDVTIRKLAEEGKDFRDTVEAISPRDGRHLYFGWDSRVTKSGSDLLGPGIDVKTNGGYIVAAPSFWRRNCKSYRWLRPPRGADLPHLPRWITDKLQPPPRPRAKKLRLPSLGQVEGYRRQAVAELQKVSEWLAALGDGRHQAPFSIGCRIGKYHRHGFLTETEIEQAVLDASANNGALSKYAIRDIIGQLKNGLRRAHNDGLPPLSCVHRKCFR